MGFNAIFKPGGAAGGVTAPDLTTGLALAATAGSIDFTITNADEENPAAIELSFAQSALKAKSWDDGDATTPSYVLEPDTARAVTFLRGASAPTYGEDSVSDTITGTLADGTTVSTTLTVNALSTFKAAVRALGDGPTFEYTMDSLNPFSGMTANTGSLGGTYDAAVSGVSPTSDVDHGLVGYIEIADAGDKISTTSVPKDDVLRTKDRSYVFVWDVQEDLNSVKNVTVGGANPTDNAWGYIQTDGTGVYKSSHLDSGWAVLLNSTNGTNDTVGASAESLVTTAVDEETHRRNLVVVIYDATAETCTVRWKQDGHGDGHTYYSDDGSSENRDGTLTMYWCGFTNNTAITQRWRYCAVVDHVVTSAEFEVLMDVIFG